MRNQEIIVSLDIGTTSIKVVVAEYMNGQVNIIGVGNEKSRGLSRGVIVDIDETVLSIQKAIEQAERKANVKINEVVVGVPSNKLAIDDCHGMIAVASENREITARDVDNVISAAKVRSVPPEREVIAILPEEFIVDGFNGIRDPRGMIGVRLELYARLMTGPRTIIHNIRRCVEKAGLSISEFVIQPQAIATTALNQDEREFGTVIIDMGGGQTSASIIYDNQLKYSFVDQEGGDYVTKDISVILNTSLDSAERIKREYGYAISSQTSPEEYFPVETVGRKEPVRVDERYLSEIIEARLVQIFETIREDLEAVDALDLPGGFVLTGGASSLPGVLELAKKYFGSQVRIYIPEQMGMRNPVYTTSVGMVEYVSKLDEVHQIAQSTFRAQRAQHAAAREGNPTLSSQYDSGRSQSYDDFENTYYQPRDGGGQQFGPQGGFAGPEQARQRPKSPSLSQPHPNAQAFQDNSNHTGYYTYNEPQDPRYNDYPSDDQYSEEEWHNATVTDPTTNEGGFVNKLRAYFQTFFD
ncbi:cell division protein FtsA [Facklamia miroungae]|uniref:Cell division protein FtsA n=1 Tax=Facklamia miroungae TaxID=120956 RepID=A0A1G7TVN5_9LACT|nr:cell division protein FtsA [Facklamia miroungae]NKZ29971.1 cell division protein FtsA [Facklamia miroungae]SDG38789.1 cell division protein FtsA [Facklamia miroungae]